MRFAGTARHTLASVAAVLAVVALAGATLASRTAAASATAQGVVTAGQEVTVEPPAPSTSTTSSTSTSTSTSTTVKPKPVTTTAPPRPTVPPAVTPATAPPVTSPPPVAPPTNTGPAERCASALQWVAQHGLVLPAGWGFRCPGQAVVGGSPRWGMACWNCAGDNTSWIAVDVGRIGPSEATLRHVIAHEICHANEYLTLGLSTEITADLCAALHGAPRP